MIAVNLNIPDEAYEKIMYLLKGLPKKDIQIIKTRTIEEIDPTTLPKDDFDYMSKEYLVEIDKSLQEAKAEGFHNLQSYEEFIADGGSRGGVYK